MKYTDKQRLDHIDQATNQLAIFGHFVMGGRPDSARAAIDDHMERCGIEPEDSKLKFSDVPVPKELHSDAFISAWNLWGAYRRQRKLPAYKPIGLKAQFTRLAEMGVKRAIAAINYSITQNYQGIYEERQGSAAQNNRSTGTLNTTGRYNLGAGVHGGQRAEAHGQVPPAG